MSCESCTDEARERMKDIDSARQKAKDYAQEINAPVAICQGDTGIFIAPAWEAVNSGNIIREVISQL